MILAWRVSKAKYLPQAFSGVGAQRYGGRWNTAGDPVIYLSDTLALAILEVLVHLPRPRHLRNQQAAVVEIPKSLIGHETRLPRGWRRNPRLTQRIGDRWLKGLATPVLAVPSVLYDCGPVKPVNYLINPLHPNFGQILIGAFADLKLDPRIS